MVTVFTLFATPRIPLIGLQSDQMQHAKLRDDRNLQTRLKFQLGRHSSGRRKT
jgi:hypothetical protein